MPRGKPKKVPVWTFETHVPTEGIDYLIRQAAADELADAVCALFEDGVKTDIFAHIIQARIDRMVYPPEQLLSELGERLQSFAPQPGAADLPPGHQPKVADMRFDHMENPEHAITGTDPA